MLLAVTDTLTRLAGCCREAVRYSSVDTVVALSVALFVNAAILMVAAAAFFNTDGETTTSYTDCRKQPMSRPY